MAYEKKPIVLRAKTVLDGKGGILRNAEIVVEGSKIFSVGSTTTDKPVTYDLSGLTIMPGWIDTHVHIGTHFEPNGRFHGLTSNIDEGDAEYILYGIENAYATLMAGFTTVQSVGALPGRDMLDRELRDWIAKGNPGPRLLLSIGMVRESTGSPDEIREFIRQSVAQGADLVKIFATKSIREGGTQTMSDEQILAACQEAEALGKRTLVHAQESAGARAAVLARCTAIEHGNRLSNEVLDLMVQHGTYYDPQFLLLHYYLENKPKFAGIDNYTEEGFAYMEQGIDIGLDTFTRALAKGVKIVFGTDALAGIHGRNHEELIYRVQDGGQDPMDAIISATSLAAESLGLQDQIGTIGPGMEADLIATAGNPIEDITVVKDVVFVMKGGRVYKNIQPNWRTGQRDPAGEKK
jgi:imidazolonepropionase-like amidohydrolase